MSWVPKIMMMQFDERDAMNGLQLLHYTDVASGKRRCATRGVFASLVLANTLAATLMLPAPHAYAQANAAATTQQVPALLGGKVEALVASGQ